MHSDQELLEEIHRLANKGDPPTVSKMDESGKYGPSTYQRRFGSWNKAVRTAGFQPRSSSKVIPERRLLEELRCHASGNLAPQATQIQEVGQFSIEPYERIGSFWQATVKSGLIPHNRRPLTDRQFNAFFDATINRVKPTQQLVVHLFQFTGLTARTIHKLTDSWITRQPTGHLITVPSKFTASGSEWVFKLPKEFGNGQETNISGLIDWYFDQYSSLQCSKKACIEAVYHTAKDASLDRRTIETSIGPAPEVRPSDLRATGGVRMARNNAPTRRIRRHLGLKHTNWNATVEDFFLYAYVHYDHEHPDYDPPDVVLDPVDPDSSPN